MTTGPTGRFAGSTGTNRTYKRDRDGKFSGGDGGTSEPQEHSTADAAREFLSDQYGGWRAGLTEGQYSALALYQSPAFAVMNGRLRGLATKDIKADVEVTPALERRATAATKQLREAIASAPPLAEPVLVHRSFSVDDIPAVRKGATIRDAGFVSTSLTPVRGGGGVGGHGASPAVARIVLPRGTKAAGGSARELVLPPGSSFRVDKVRRRNGVTYIDMELILDGG